MKLKEAAVEIRPPQTLDECHDRDALLALSLREEPFPFPISKEYPLVLNPSDTSKSFCVFYDGKIIAHANLFHRECAITHYEHDRSGIKLSLIGNVATHPDWRAKGIMRALFEYLEISALKCDSSALILWSDLNSFYDKLGFVPWGKEIRYDLSREKIAKCLIPNNYHFSAKADLNILSDLLYRRCEIPTIRRSAREFAELLKIPWTDFRMLKNTSNGTLSYGVMGKGADMGGVIHEWGAENELDFLALLASFFSHNNTKKLTLLCPGILDEKWRIFFNGLNTQENVYPMCLLKILQKTHKETLEKLFVWGLDGI